MAFGRGDNIDGRMPKSISTDLGKTWTYRPSPFPPIGGGQRLVLLRLREGPIFFASFAKTDHDHRRRRAASGRSPGLFAALSTDEGETWHDQATDHRRRAAPGRSTAAATPASSP